MFDWVRGYSMLDRDYNFGNIEVQVIVNERKAAMAGIQK